MRPLREQTDSLDPNLLAAQALLAKVPPLEPSADRQRRVRLRLDATTRQALPPLLRPALVAAVLLAVTAAGAKMGGVLPESPAKAIERFFSKPVEAMDAPIAQTKARSQAAAKAKAAQQPSEASLDVTDLPLEDATHAKRLRQPMPSASTPGAKLMVEAMQARRDGNTAKASKLLKEYQRKYPEGALQEEALALSMEAAAARGDASATKLARQYLERYPNGRFREQAQRVLRPAQR